MSFNTYHSAIAPNSLPVAYPVQPTSPSQREGDYLKEVTVRPIQKDEANSCWNTVKIILLAALVFIGILVTSGGFGLAVAGIAAGKATLALLGTATGVLAGIATLGATLYCAKLIFGNTQPLPNLD